MTLIVIGTSIQPMRDSKSDKAVSTAFIQNPAITIAVVKFSHQELA